MSRINSIEKNNDEYEKCRTFASVVKDWLGNESPEAMGVRVGIHGRTIRYWMENVNLPASTKLPFIAGMLGVSVNELAGLVRKARAARSRRHYRTASPRTSAVRT
jgi:hypothetical protein